jgi:hypothetical protein
MTSSQKTDVTNGDDRALAMRLAAIGRSTTHLDTECISMDHRDRVPAGKIYSGIVAQGDSRMQNGDIYNIYNNPEPSATDTQPLNAEDKLLVNGSSRVSADGRPVCNCRGRPLEHLSMALLNTRV